MSILIINCFDWVGFHIVNDLLAEGYKVDGIDLTISKKTEHFAMYTGRNSSFKLITSADISDSYSVIIMNLYEQVKEAKVLKSLYGKNKLFLNDDKNSLKLIRFALLFGEWMPMDSKGMYCGDKYIPFDSELFIAQSSYISCLTDNILKSMNQSNKRQVFRIELEDERTISDQKLEINQSIRDNVPKEVNLKKVLQHYDRFKSYY